MINMLAESAPHISVIHGEVLFKEMSETLTLDSRKVGVTMSLRNRIRCAYGTLSTDH